MPDALKGFDIVRVRGGQRRPDVDQAAAEEPLEVRLHNRPFAVIMRTPGADRELAAGFLLAEQVIRGAEDLGTIEYCRERATPDTVGAELVSALEGRRQAPPLQHAGNIINVTLAGDAAGRLEALLANRRQVSMNASCGMCGRQTIESLRADKPALSVDGCIRVDAIAALPDCLRAAQATFDVTGGLHAAGLFAFDGTLETMAEDIGRHNAVDKVIGRMLIMDALPLDGRLLFVSGRTSFEIVQKAFLAGIPVVASVSAPSSLAIDLAREVGVTLAGFVRGDSFNLYSHAERVM
jgi:FdhD protein